MTALLALYMVKQLLLPGHAEHVIGLVGPAAPLRVPRPDVGPGVRVADLRLVWRAGLLHAADRRLGRGPLARQEAHRDRRRAADERGPSRHVVRRDLPDRARAADCRLGFLKGNIAAQVGTLYPKDAESLRERGFTIFSTAINIGAVAGPLATGSVALIYGWHAGFALAAALMLLALIVYLFGSRTLPSHAQARADKVTHPPLTHDEKVRTWCLLAVIALMIPVSVTYTMIWNIGVVWVDQHVDLVSPFGAVPASWFNSVDSFASIVIAPVLIALWAWQARRKHEPASLTKIAIGRAITGVSGLLLAIGCLTAGSDGRVSVIWPLLGWFGMGVGFMWYWPIALSLVSKAAPAKVNSTLMGGCYLALFFGSAIMGWVGSFYDQMSNAAFWTHGRGDRACQRARDPCAQAAADQHPRAAADHSPGR